MRRILSVLMAGLILLLCASCAAGSTSASSSNESADISASSEAQISESPEISESPHSPESSDATDTASDGSGSGQYFTDFSAQDIYGADVTQDVFADHELNLVNIMATWCRPCISEIPELEEMYKAGELGIVGIVTDTSNKGEVDSDAVDTAKYIAETLEVTYPMLIPDASDFGGLIPQIQAVPTSFFVDSKGKLVAGPVEGSRDADSWRELAAEAEKYL